MTTYDGRGYKYDSKGKEVVNREPPVSKHIVEKLYRIHRTNVLNVEPLTDSHVVIPEFLTNMAWKKLGEKKKKRDQLVQNEKVYQRISKVENNPSRISSDIREHIKRVEDVRDKMLKLSEAGRLKHLLRIQRDNTVILERIEKARPSITSEGIKEWYKPHELYKDGRRSDVTAGHIMHNMRGLLPSRLPALEGNMRYLGSVGSRSLSTERLEKMAGSSSSVYSSIGMGSVATMPSVAALPAQDDGYGYLNALRSSISAQQLSSSLELALSPGAGNGRRVGKVPSQKSIIRTQSNELHKSPAAPLPSPHIVHSSSHKLPPSSAVRPHSADGGMGKAAAANGSGADESVGESTQELDSTIGSAVSDSEDEEEEGFAIGSGDNTFVVLTSRPFPLPYESKNCQVTIGCLADPDDMLYIRVHMFGDPPVFLGERIIHKNKANEIINSTNNLAQQAAINEDLQALRAVLINMFKEADDDGNGFLTFDEFQVLLEKVDLGISSQEMRFVISEADENENGVVDYCEFVPLAVDMIQSFRARNRAKTQTSQADSEIDEVIMQSLSQSEIESITEACLAKLREVDTKNYGVLRPNDVRRCLNSCGSMFMNEKEITMICQSLPRDPFNRCIYGGLREVVSKIRFMTLKNNYVEARGSDLHKYLLERCREEERLIGQRREASNEVETGRLPFRAMTNLLQSSPRLSLSRLQVMVIMAEASAVEGMVDYYQFCPVVAKTIEIMFEPKTLRQRAELIEKTDLSPEALLAGLSTEEFRQKLLILFKSYDIDKSGALDKDEFKSCLQALDFHLTDGEIAALKVTADLRTSTALSEEDFINFFSQNLLHLEREKHLQILQKSLHQGGAANSPQKRALGTSVRGPNIAGISKLDLTTPAQYAAHLETIFKLADSDGTGSLDKTEFENLLMSLDIKISQFQLDCIISELDINHDARIEYKEFIPICADLLAAFKAKEKAQEEREKNEDWASRKAQRIMKSSMHDINHIVRYIKERVCLIEETIEDAATRMSTIQEVIRNPHSGLSRTEANSIIMKLFTLEAIMNRSRYSFRKHVTKPTGRAPGANSTAAAMAGSRKAAVVPGKDHAAIINAQDEISRHEGTGEAVLTTHDLRCAVIDAREKSIMRSLLEDIDPGSLEQLLTQSCESIYEKMVADGQLSSSSEYLPVNVLFGMLEKLPNLRLNKPQLMAILSWVPQDCYDGAGTSVDFRQFSLYAAGVITKMRKPDAMDNRANILDDVDLSDEALLMGLTEKSLHDYFVTEFSAKHSDEKISEANFCTIIMNVPHLKLTKIDAMSILGSFPRSVDGTITWREFLPWSHNTILHLLREKAIQSVMLKKQIEDEKKREAESKRSVFKDLSEKLIEYVKIKQQGDIVHVYLPGDNTQRRSLVLRNRLLSPNSGKPDHRISARDEIDDEDERFNLSATEAQILRVGVVLRAVYSQQMELAPPTSSPIRTTSKSGKIPQQKSPSARMQSPGFGAPIKKPEALPAASPAVAAPPTPARIPVFIRIVAINSTSGHDKDLVAKVWAVDGSYSEVMTLPLRLPSLGICDKEAAELFASNIISKMYVELPHPQFSPGGKPKLIVDIK